MQGTVTLKRRRRRAAAAPRMRSAPARPAAAAPPPLDWEVAAARLVEDVAAKLDEICFVWEVIRELEPFVARGEPSLRAEAAAAYVLGAAGSPELRIEALLEPLIRFLDRKGMDERHVRFLHAWYRQGAGGAGEAGGAPSRSSSRSSAST